MRSKQVRLDNYLRLCLLSPAIHGIQVLAPNPNGNYGK
jgi:hypothetical protein